MQRIGNSLALRKISRIVFYADKRPVFNLQVSLNNLNGFRRIPSYNNHDPPDFFIFFKFFRSDNTVHHRLSVFLPPSVRIYNMYIRIARRDHFDVFSISFICPYLLFYLILVHSFFDQKRQKSFRSALCISV